MSMPFAALLLRQFRQLEHFSSQLPPLDLLYITLLEQLYITPNRVWISDLHAATNQLGLAQQIGGISQEKDRCMETRYGILGDLATEWVAASTVFIARTLTGYS